MAKPLSQRDLVRVECLGGPSDGDLYDLDRARLIQCREWVTYPGHVYRIGFRLGAVVFEYVGCQR